MYIPEKRLPNLTAKYNLPVGVGLTRQDVMHLSMQMDREDANTLQRDYTYYTNGIVDSFLQTPQGQRCIQEEHTFRYTQVTLGKAPEYLAFTTTEQVMYDLDFQDRNKK